jgi:hypothetical protein
MDEEWVRDEHSSFYKSPGGIVLKVEMAVSSKGLPINRIGAYERHGVTYRHI